MKHDIEQLLQQALSPTEEPDLWLNEKILQTAKENEYMKKRRSRIPTGAAVAVLTLMIASLGVFAGWKYLAPQNVAKVFADESLAKAFETEDAILINETQEYGGYKITLLGIVSGKGLSDYTNWDDEGNLIDDMTYIVTAIENADGTPRPSTSDDAYGEDSFYVSPYIKGLPMWEYNAHSLTGGGYSECVVDGIQYRILEIGNLEIFANRGIYLGVSSGSFYNSEAFVMDETTGEITRNESCKELNALFKLLIPAFKGDETAVEAFLEEFEEKYSAESDTADEASEEPETESDRPAKIAEETADWTLEDFHANAKCFYEEKLSIDEDNSVSYEYEFEDGSGSEATQWLDHLFPEKQTGAFVAAAFYASDNEEVTIETFELLEDGTVMLRVFLM